jgi:biopolymer transport protein ExbD
MGEVVYLTHRKRRRGLDASVIANINITPLIDVMLVLIVMLILAVPATMHQTTVELPQHGGITNEKPVMQNLLVTSDGVYHWNGSAIDDAALAGKLRSLVAAGDELRIETDGYARYERFNQLIAMVKEAGVTKLGFVGNHRYKEWDKPV